MIIILRAHNNGKLEVWLTLLCHCRYNSTVRENTALGTRLEIHRPSSLLVGGRPADCFSIKIAYADCFSSKIAYKQMCSGSWAESHVDAEVAQRPT